MNEFIKSAAEKMLANYLNCDFFPRETDKILPDEKSIEKIIHDTRKVIFPGYFGDEILSESGSRSPFLTLCKGVYRRTAPYTGAYV